MADDGPLQLSCSTSRTSRRSLADFPGERLVACRTRLAADRARTREDLLAATEKLLAPPSPGSGRPPAGRRRIGVAVGKVITRYKTGKHFAVTITDTTLTIERRGSDRRRGRPGRVLRAAPRPAPADEAAVVTAYRTSNTSNGTSAHQIRRPGPAAGLPPPGRTRPGPRADLHARLLPHLAPAPRLGPADLHRPGPARAGQPGHPGRRSAAAQAKASGQHDAAAPLQLPRPAGAPGHLDPQPGPVPAPAPPCRCWPSRPAPSGKPSSSSASRSR